MNAIMIDRFRSLHQDGKVTLTAALSTEPPPHWIRRCESTFAHYLRAFGERPALIDATIVVQTTTADLETSQLALEALVEATNSQYADSR